MTLARKAATPPIVTDVPEKKPAPRMVTVLPENPEVGDTDVRVSAE